MNPRRNQALFPSKQTSEEVLLFCPICGFAATNPDSAMSSLYHETITVTLAEIAHWLHEAEHAVLLQLANGRHQVPPASLEVFNTLNRHFLRAMAGTREKQVSWPPQTHRRHTANTPSNKNEKKELTGVITPHMLASRCRTKGAKTNEN